MRKKRNAFTLIEVLIATAVLGSSVAVLSRLHFGSLMRVAESSQKIERIFFVKKYLYQLWLTPPTKEKPEKHALEKPELQVLTQKREIDQKKSSLKEFAKEIDIIQAEGTWGEKKQKIQMISFVLKQPTEEQK